MLKIYTDRCPAGLPSHSERRQNYFWTYVTNTCKYVDVLKHESTKTGIDLAKRRLA